MKEERIRILYIDDRPDEVDAIVESLSEEFDVKLMPDAEAAQKELIENHYDIIILDYEMIKQGDADKILAKIREQNYHIRVIMVTAKLRYIRQLARIINLGISKCYFKDDSDLMDNLKTGIREVVENRNEVIMGLESWLSARAAENNVMLVSGEKSYTAKELLEEIKKNSEVGRNEVKALALLAITLLK
ncbi:MAG: response regulator transcription factor, partial [Nitrososphaerales archaeon]